MRGAGTPQGGGDIVQPENGRGGGRAAPGAPIHLPDPDATSAPQMVAG